MMLILGIGRAVCMYAYAAWCISCTEPYKSVNTRVCTTYLLFSMR